MYDVTYSESLQKAFRINAEEKKSNLVTHRKTGLFVLDAHVSCSEPHRLDSFVEGDAVHVLAGHGELSCRNSFHSYESDVSNLHARADKL